MPITRISTVLGLAALLTVGGCDLFDGEPEPPPGYGYPAFFNYPAWHPSGNTIAASHTDSVDTDGDGRLDDRFAGPTPSGASTTPRRRTRWPTSGRLWAWLK